MKKVVTWENYYKVLEEIECNDNDVKDTKLEETSREEYSKSRNDKNSTVESDSSVLSVNEKEDIRNNADEEKHQEDRMALEEQLWNKEHIIERQEEETRKLKKTSWINNTGF